MPMINGMWVDDATGVPDQGMPPGMGDPTGGSVPPGGPAPAMTPPMASPQRPMPGQQMTPPSPQMQMLMNPAAAGIAPEAVSPELTPGMVNQEWNKINRPPEWDAGRIATTIASLPVTAPIQLIEGIRGLFGGDTIQGWKEQADARYSNPNYSESRAFGVTGVAKEPDYGDRWTGIITGRSQQGAMAGKLMRQEIGRYTKQRSQELKDFKYIGDIYAQGQTLQKNANELNWAPGEHDLKMRRGEAGIRASNAATTASGLAGRLAQFNLNDKQARQARADSLFAAIQQDPELAKDTKRLMELAGGDLDLVVKAQNAYRGAHTLPDPLTGLTQGATTTLQAQQIPAIAEDFVTDRRTQDQRAADDAVLQAKIAREQADKDRAEAIAANTAAGTAQTALTGIQRQRIEEPYDPQKGARALQAPQTSWTASGNKQQMIDYLAQLDAEKGRVLSMFESGALSPEGASAIARRTAPAATSPNPQPTPMGQIVPPNNDPTLEDPAIQRMLMSGAMDPDAFNAAIEGKYPMPVPAPTATPTLPPRSQVLPERSTGESPAAVGEQVRQRLLGDLLGPRKTPMATPTRPTAGPLATEGERRENADRVTRERELFDSAWKAQRPGKPVGGADYQAAFERHLANKGLRLETLK